jgi:hypothetical protein
MSNEVVDLSSGALKASFNLDASLPRELMELVESVTRVEIFGDSLSNLAELYSSGNLRGDQLHKTHTVLECLVRNDLALRSVFLHWMTGNNWRTWQKYQRDYAFFMTPLKDLKNRLNEEAQPRLFE